VSWSSVTGVDKSIINRAKTFAMIGSLSVSRTTKSYHISFDTISSPSIVSAAFAQWKNPPTSIHITGARDDGGDDYWGDDDDDHGGGPHRGPPSPSGVKKHPKHVAVSLAASDRHSGAHDPKKWRRAKGVHVYDVWWYSDPSQDKQIVYWLNQLGVAAKHYSSTPLRIGYRVRSERNREQFLNKLTHRLYHSRRSVEGRGTEGPLDMTVREVTEP
jgi:hypothetical protein